MPLILPIDDNDFERLYEIERQAHLIPWSFGMLKNNRGERYLNLKLVENNHIIGFAICQTVLDEATLFNIAVEPTRQGKGMGELLLRELMTRLTERAVKTLWLEVRESNPARHLYEKLGFNEVDIRKNYYPLPNGGRENAVVMACYLSI